MVLYFSITLLSCWCSSTTCTVPCGASPGRVSTALVVNAFSTRRCTILQSSRPHSRLEPVVSHSPVCAGVWVGSRVCLSLRARARQKNAQVGSRNAACTQQFTEGLWCESSRLDTVRPVAVRHFVQLAPRVQDVFLFDKGHLVKRPLEAREASDLVDHVCDAEARLAHPVACTRHRGRMPAQQTLSPRTK